MRAISVLHELTVVVSGLDEVLLQMEMLLSCTVVTTSYVRGKCILLNSASKAGREN